MTREPENEIIAGKELNEIIAAAKVLGIKLTNPLFSRLDGSVSLRLIFAVLRVEEGFALMRT